MDGFDAFMKGVILSMNILMSASKITIFYISEFELYVSILGYITLYFLKFYGSLDMFSWKSLSDQCSYS